MLLTAVLGVDVLLSHPYPRLPLTPIPAFYCTRAAFRRRWCQRRSLTAFAWRNVRRIFNANAVSKVRAERSTVSVKGCLLQTLTPKP